ncbi:hypothetical protein Pryu01_00517 [Paraliobacillus ryukyuensis]|uniref:Competence-related pilin export protein ComGB n=1 Tax=Paraliobacillus ryukyuensis TaxID=200904 RepID=A0A366EI63_9BACI|nr:type II secretion system F family protein [Paraliobacillus ryukyuensis]RBP01410.1 competence-related pilin export protein ComGB [Paraliobacillus ryukyuensis]
MHMDLAKKSKFKKLSSSEQNKFLIRLTRLLEQDYSLIDALNAMKWNATWKEQINHLMGALKRGKSIDDALQQAKFDNKVVSFLYFANAHGNMSKALKQSIQLIEQNNQLWIKFKQAIRYPVVLFLLFISLLYFIKSYVFPAFMQLFASTAYVSNITLLALQIIQLFFHALIIGTLLIALTSLTWLLMQRHCNVETIITIYQRLPIMRLFAQTYTTFLFTLHLSSLLQSGLSLKRSLTVLTQQSHYQIIRYYSNMLIDHLAGGLSIEHILPSLHLLAPDLETIFFKNNNVEELAKDMRGFADHLLEQMQNKTKKIIAWIQPTFFVMMATSIIFIYMSLLYPMFQLIQTI